MPAAIADRRHESNSVDTQLSRGSCVPWADSDSYKAVQAITDAKSTEQKQQAIDAYMDRKIEFALSQTLCRTSHQTAACLSQRLEALSVHLSSDDKQLVKMRGDLFIHHMAALLRQKGLAQVWNEESKRQAAKVACKADRQYDIEDAIGLVIAFMSKSLHDRQGQHARYGSLLEPRKDVEGALAFPKSPQWKK